MAVGGANATTQLCVNAMALEKLLLLVPINLGSIIRPLPSFNSKKDYSQVENIQHSWQFSQQIHPKDKPCRATSHTLQASARSMLKSITVQLERDNKYGLFGRAARGKPLLSDLVMRLMFAKLHLNKPQDF